MSQSARASSKIRSTLAYYYAFIILGLITGVFGPTLAALARHTQSTLSEISILFAARSFGYLIGSFLSGRLFDRIRGHPLLVGALLATALAFALIPLIPALWLLTAIVLLLGIAEGGIDVGGNSMLLWMHRENPSPFLNGLHFFFGVGAFLSPIVVAQVVLSTGEIGWAYWLLALVTLPAAAWLIRLPSPPPQNDSAKDIPARVSPLLVTSIALFFFLYVGAEVGYGNWIFTYATKLNLSDATSAALLTSGFWGAFTLGRLIGVPLSARFNPKTILFVDLIGALASVCGVLAFSHSITALWLGTIGIGLFMASIFPTMLAFAGRKMAITGEVTAWFMIGAGGGGMFLPWLIGQLFEPVGATIAPFLVLTNLAGAFVVLGLVLARESQSQFSISE
jgi:MFS transporter, FHS family, Na+ dependent glucose transporter 1